MKQNKITKLVTLTLILLMVSSVIAINPLTYTEPKAVQVEQLNNVGDFTNNLFTGAATYSYQIQVPPGINGLQPSILMSYNHQSKSREELGLGWTLSKSYIYRDTKSTRDNTADDVYHLVINGNDMKLVYSQQFGAYKTEYETYIEGLFSSNNDQWTFRSKDGVRYFFGHSLATKQVSTQESYTSIWFLEEIEEPHGNEIFYEYIKDPSGDEATYLTEINYGDNSIEFIYEFNQHIGFNGYDHGTRIKKTALLDQVYVTNSNNVVRRYSFDYKTEDMTKLLTKITQYGEGGIQEFNDVEFTYYDNNPGWSLDNAWKFPSMAFFGENQDHGIRIFDYNADGLNDIVQANDDLQKVWFNNGNGFNYPQTLNSIMGNGFVDEDYRDLGTRFGDFNGDGRTDVMKAVEGTTDEQLIHINNGQGFSTMPFPSVLNSMSFMDLDYFQECDPPSCELGYSFKTDCNNYYCERSCGGGPFDICEEDEDDWVLVYDETAGGYNTGDSEEKSNLLSYKPQSNNKCYKFFIDTPNDIDIQVDENECYNGDSDTDGDTVIFGTLYTPYYDETSWLSTVPAVSSKEGWYEELDYPFDGADFQYDYLFTHEYSGGSLSENDKENFAAADFTVYCTPDDDICDLGLLDSYCGYGCEDQKTKLKIQSGYYEDPDLDITSSWLEAIAYDEPCDDSETYVNKAQTPAMKVYEADVIEVNSYKTKCAVETHMKDQGYRLADVDGDGRTDVIRSWPSAKTYLNKENGWNLASEWSIAYNINWLAGPDGEDEGRRMSDVNGDGLIDLIEADEYGRETWINNGEGWTQEENWKVPIEAIFVKDFRHQGVQLVDVNNDGFVDILKKNKNDEKVWLNTGEGWELSNNWEIPDDFKFEIGTTVTDIDGDGMPDLIKSVSLSSSDRKTWINDYEKQNLLHTIKNKMGGVTTIDYKKMSDIDNTGTDSVSDLSFNGWVVELITQNNNLANTHQVFSITSYNYLDGKYDSEYDEFMGFGYVQEFKEGSVNPAQDMIIIDHLFHQDKAKKGREYETIIKGHPATIYKQIQRNYNSYVNNGLYTITLLDETVSQYDGSAITTDITKIEYEYDMYGNAIEIKNLGNAGSEGDETTENIWYDYNFLKGIVNQPIEHKFFDSEGVLVKQTYYSYNTNGDLISEEYVNFAGENPSIERDYDSYGNVISVISPEGHSNQYEYDSSHTFMLKETNTLNHEVSYEYDEGTGNALSVTSPNGFVTNYNYDKFGRKIKEIIEGDSIASPTVEYIYDFDGVAPEKVVTRTKEDADNTFDTYSYYGGFGRLVETKTESEDQFWITHENKFDSQGRLKEKSQLNKISPTSAYSVSPNFAKKTIYNYDPLNRITKVTFIDGTEIDIDYDKSLTSTYDQNNVRKDYLKNAYGQIIEVVEYNEGEEYSTSYEYDGVGHLIKIIDDQNNEINYEFDSLGRRTSVESLNSGTWDYEYDLEGNLVYQEDDNGNVIEIEYDDLNREESKSSDSGTVLTIYDLDKIGTISMIQTPAVTKNYEYDSRLRVVEETKEIDNINFVTTYTYDSLNRVLTKTLPNGEVIEQTYNNQGKTDSVVGVLDNVNYDEFGSITKREYVNGLTTEYTYDNEIHKLEKIKTSSLQDLSYEYDSVLNLLELVDSVNNLEYSMAYDDLNRLTHAENEDFDIDYSYDSIGNLLGVEFFDNGLVGEIAYTYTNPAHSPSSIVISGDVFDGSYCEDSTSETYCSEDKMFVDHTYEDCSSVTELQEVCEFGCSEGSCLDDPCSEIICDNYCEGYDYNVGSCSAGECVFELEPESAQCGWSEPVCYSNEDCGAAYWLDNKVCDENYENILDSYVSPSCVDAGIPSAVCVEDVEILVKDECNYGCDFGECVEIDFNTDPMNCGEFGVMCKSYEDCFNGICMPARVKPQFGELQVRVNAVECDEVHWISPFTVNIYDNAEIDDENQIVDNPQNNLVDSETVFVDAKKAYFNLEPGVYAIEATKSGYKDRAINYNVEWYGNVLSITLTPIEEPICSEPIPASNEDPRGESVPDRSREAPKSVEKKSDLLRIKKFWRNISSQRR
jgi:YD repeat-containing protein